MPVHTEPPGEVQRQTSRVPSGIGPLDERLGGLTRGGLYLLSGGEVDTRHYLSLVYLREGLRAGNAAALITQVPRNHLLRRLRQWGFTELSDAWNEGRLHISGYRGGFEHRIRNAGDPDTVFEDLDRRIHPDADRVALVPGRPLWKGVLGPVMTEAFIGWANRTSATVWATCQSTDGDGADDERLHHASTGVFQLTEDDRGRPGLRVRKTAAADPEPVTLPLSSAFSEIAGRPNTPAVPRALLMKPAQAEDSTSFSTIGGWLERVTETTEVTDPMSLLEVLQDDADLDLVVVFAAPDDLGESVRACHLAGSVGHAPVVAVVEDRVRAADRAHLIRAGADECLSGPVNLSELASRLDRLLPGPDRFGPATAEEPETGTDAVEDDRRRDGGRVTEKDFRGVVQRGLSSDRPEVFTVVKLPREALPAEAEERLSETVRLEDGDFVGPLAGGVGVYLAGTSPEEAKGFLDRLASTYGGVDEAAELLGSVRDADALRRLAGNG